jgi:hypothetical protein
MAKKQSGIVKFVKHINNKPVKKVSIDLEFYNTMTEQERTKTCRFLIKD